MKKFGLSLFLASVISGYLAQGKNQAAINYINNVVAAMDTVKNENMDSFSSSLWSDTPYNWRPWVTKYNNKKNIMLRDVNVDLWDQYRIISQGIVDAGSGMPGKTLNQVNAPASAGFNDAMSLVTANFHPFDVCSWKILPITFGAILGFIGSPAPIAWRYGQTAYLQYQVATLIQGYYESFVKHQTEQDLSLTDLENLLKIAKFEFHCPANNADRINDLSPLVENILPTSNDENAIKKEIALHILISKQAEFWTGYKNIILTATDIESLASKLNRKPGISDQRHMEAVLTTILFIISLPHIEYMNSNNPSWMLYLYLGKI